MIRRDARAEDGTPVWVLVDQVEHARVSGDLARSWGGAGFTPPDPHHTVVSAIYRHDDGWPVYDQAPDTDPAAGLPCEFTEMEMHTANAIWSGSIEKVADLGPLAQYIVASHFVTLRCEGQRADSPEAVRFIRTYRARCQQWLAEWQQASPANTPQRAHTALAHLQLFDALSLWLCLRSADGRDRLHGPSSAPPSISTP